MNDKQKDKYFWEWSRTAKRLREKGRNPTEAIRQEITLLALGYPRSSKLFNNEEFDKVLFLLRTIEGNPENWVAHLSRDQSPKLRYHHLAVRLTMEAMPHITTTHHAESYLGGTAKRMYGLTLADLAAEQWAALVASATYHLLRQNKKRAEEGIAVPAGDIPSGDETPFGW